jgi:hypothetical protein
MNRMMSLLLGAMALSACTTFDADRTGDVAAFAGESRAEACEGAARRLTTPDGTTAGAPWSGTPWSDAREWTVATGSSKAAIERDIRRAVSRDCVRASPSD